MVSPEQIIVRLIVAAVLGGLVGLERERLEWAAGLRTHALVCMGSALFMLVSSFGFSEVLDENNVGLDPSRVAAQVASGIGFIGAGTIILRREREIVEGLTTAASVWAVAAVGLAIGGGLFLAGVATTLLSLVILVLVKPIKRRLFPNCRARFVTLAIDQSVSLAELRSEIDTTNLHLDRIAVRPSSTENEDEAELVLSKGSKEGDLLALTDEPRRVSGVHEVNSLLNGSTESRT
jgi:putative Mg2+ transporter-C (MgtC) family protein